MKSYRNLKLTLLLLISVCIVFCAVSVFFLIIQKNDQTKLGAASVSGADFKYGAITSDSETKYKNNTSFVISDKKGLDNFAASVNAGVDFKGKTVYLTADIDYDQYYDDPNFAAAPFKGVGVNPDGLDQYYFKGTFKGENHTISNLQIKQGRTYVYNEYKVGHLDGGPAGIGFFAGLSENARVENLKIKNALYLVTNWLTPFSDELCIGGIVGFIPQQVYTYDPVSQVTISNCAVENIQIQNYGVSSSVEIGLGGNNGTDVIRYIGGIAGAMDNPSYWDSDHGKLTILNCSVSQFQSYVHKKPYFLNYTVGVEYHDMAGAFVGYLPKSTGQINNCVFDETNSFCAYESGTKHKFRYANGGYWLDTSTVGNAVYVFPKTDDYGHGDTSFTNLSKNAVGGSSSSWYYAPEYSAYPLLRSFITWKEISFNAKNGKVDISSILVPDDANKTFSSNSQKITVYNRDISATANDGYEIDKWICNSSISYTANFKLKPYKISFASPKLNASYVLVSRTSLTMGFVYKVVRGTDSGFNWTVQENANKTVKSITYSFIDIDNTERSITYTAKDGYYLKLIDNFTPESITADLLNISVEVIPKDYGIGII